MMLSTTFFLGLAFQANQPQFLEKPPVETFVPNAYFRMVDDTKEYEFKLNATGPWISFESHTGSKYRLFLSSGDGVVSETQYANQDNVIAVREISTGGLPNAAVTYNWQITLPVNEDGTDSKDYNDPNDDRTWHVLSPSEIGTIDGEPIARLGYRPNGGDATFHKAHPVDFLTKPAYFVQPGKTGIGTLDDPADPVGTSFATLASLWISRVVHLPGDYLDPASFYTETGGGPADPGIDFELLGTPGARIIQQNNKAAARFIDPRVLTFQGFDIVGAQHTNLNISQTTIGIQDGNVVVVDSCRLSGSNGAGIIIGGSSEVKNVTISNCEIYDFYCEGKDRIGILVRPNCRWVDIIGNHIYQNSGDGIQVTANEASSPSAIPIFARDIVITGNRLHDDRENGIDLKSSENVRIAENLFYGFSVETSGATTSPALKVHHGASDVEIEYNQIGYSKQGINLANGAEDGWLEPGNPKNHFPNNVKIRRNLIHDGEVEGNPNGVTFGIKVRGSENVDIANNEVRGWSYGIDVVYDVIATTQPNFPTVDEPTPGSIVNNLIVDAVGVPSMQIELNGANGYQVWPSTELLEPNAWVSNGAQAELRIAVQQVNNQQEIEDWMSLPTKLDFQSEYNLSGSFIFPMEMLNWINASSFGLDVFDLGVLVPGLTDDYRSRVWEPSFGKEHIGIY